MGETNHPDLLSFSKTAKSLKVHRVTVADLVVRFGIEPKPMPSLGNAKGLDSNDRAKLKRLLDPSRAGRPLAASA